ncbi:MAG: site-specific integrase [Bradyrhizobium sp.]
MATGNITKTAVDRLGGGWLWDAGHRAAVNGFGVRRQTDGAFYYIRYRLAGRQRMKSIGRHGSPWTADTARTKAKELLGIVARGDDPARQRREDETFGSAVARYLALRAPPALKPKSFAEVSRHLSVDAKPLHALSLGEIDRRAIAERLAKIEAGSGRVTRNRARSSLSAFFAWAIAEGLTEANPVTGTLEADEGGSRDRVLSQDELRTLWRNLPADRYGDIIRLLILTGQRREEIGGLRWDEIASEASGSSSLCFPPPRTKNGREHTLPLSPQAAAILARQSRRGEFVFGSARGFTVWSYSKAGLDARLDGVAPWRLHDLRRSVATLLGDKLGVLPHVVEAILNHVSGHKAGVAGVYNLAKYSDEVRDALTRWADYIDALA